MQNLADNEFNNLPVLPDIDAHHIHPGRVKQKQPHSHRPEKLALSSITGRQYQTLVDICKTGTVMEMKIALRAYIHMLEDLIAKL